VPLVALGCFVAIVAGFARILGPGAVLAGFIYVVWVPLLLWRAFGEVAGLRSAAAAVAALATHGLWLLGPGWYFYNQVGHLL